MPSTHQSAQPFVRQVAATLARHRMLAPGERVAVAVSGGADSVALLRGLVEQKDELGVVLLVAHFHHRIRPEAEQDAAFVRELAEKSNLEFLLGEADVPAHAQAQQISLETAARDLRYRWLNSLAVEKVVTAHTLDDQAETVLMKFLRGAWTRGLSGIWPVVEAARAGEPRLIRPLLDTGREDVLAYLKALQQPWREDASNLDVRHTRNKVRHELLPLLRREHNPNIDRILADMAEVARGEEEYWTRATVTDDPAVEVKSLLGLPVAFQRRIVRSAFYAAAGLELDFQHTDGLLRFLAAKQEKDRFQLAQDWLAVCDRKSGTLRFERGAGSGAGRRAGTARQDGG